MSHERIEELAKEVQVGLWGKGDDRAMKSTHGERTTRDAGAAFRIQGVGLDFEKLTRELGHAPTHTHRLGDRHRATRTYPTDMWTLSSPLPENEPLEAHIMWLADVLLPRAQFVRSIGDGLKADIYCNQGCYTEQSSVVVSSQALRLFTELGMILQVSLLFLPYEAIEQKELRHAIRRIEEGTGNSLSSDDVRRFHDEISGQENTLDETVEIGKGLFGADMERSTDAI